MGKSLAPDAPFDLVHSYARLRDSRVEIVLRGGDPATAGVYGEAVLRGDGSKVRGVVSYDEDAHGPRVVVHVARDRLSDGTWSLRLRGDDAPPSATRTRLLVQGKRPLVLLWGGRDGDSRLPAPRAERHEDTVGPQATVRGLVARLRPQRG